MTLDISSYVWTDLLNVVQRKPGKYDAFQAACPTRCLSAHAQEFWNQRSQHILQALEVKSIDSQKSLRSKHVWWNSALFFLLHLQAADAELFWLLVRNLDGQNHQSPIASVQRTLSTLASHSAVPCGTNVKQMNANHAIPNRGTTNAGSVRTNFSLAILR